MSFADDIKKFAEKTGRSMSTVKRETFLTLTDSIMRRSPVGDASSWMSPPPPGYVGGRFRGNWQPTINNPASGNLETIDPSGGIAIGKAQEVAAQEKGDDSLWLVNNLAYGPRLEDGYSGQAPHGMVGLAVREFKSAVKKAVNKA
jgi:hypothetical protein